MTGYHHDLGVRVCLAESRQGLQPVQAGHLHVEQHYMGMELRVRVEGVHAGLYRPHLHIFVLQESLERLAHSPFVVYNQNPSCHYRTRR